MKIERDAPAIATIDCEEGLGLCVGPKAMDLAIEKAKVRQLERPWRRPAIPHSFLFCRREPSVASSATAAGQAVGRADYSRARVS
jgi:hypothetical protein